MSVIRASVLKGMIEHSTTKDRRVQEIIYLLEEEPYYNKHMALFKDDKRWKELKVILGLEPSQSESHTA